MAANAHGVPSLSVTKDKATGKTKGKVAKKKKPPAAATTASG